MTQAPDTGSAQAQPTSPPTTPQPGTAQSGAPATAPAAAQPAPPCTMVIFGAHGDLTKRLLMPALYNLASGKLLDDGFRIVGVDRTPGGDDAWRKELSDTMQEFTHDPSAEFYVKEIDPQAWGWVTQRLSYVQGDFTKPEDIQRLGDGLKGSVLFYLAIAARFFGGVVEQLGSAGLLKQEEGSFRRVVIEKPFGSDLESAKALNAKILTFGDESQFYRIDHFLGKETIQNIMALRFANGIFEPLWSREHIDHVQITAAETVGVEMRGAFYEPTGALRDMVPNHLFQMLGMIAMEPPNSFDAEDVRDEKAKVIRAISPVAPENVVRGQYTAGEIAGKAMAGYRDEPGVAKDSGTETYVAMQFEIDNWRWAGVPFYVRTGKRLGGRATEIVVHFRQAPYALFRDTPVDRLAPNMMVFSIQPTEGLSLSISAKHPGPTMTLAGVDLAFRYQDAFKVEPNVGYETLLYDCLHGDPTLFQRADNIEAGWAAVEPALKAAADGSAKVEDYPAGSYGPKGADALLERSGRHWHSLVRHEAG
jgi:glucose-6-phosphate 1-dehydrogenase